MSKQGYLSSRDLVTIITAIVGVLGTVAVGYFTLRANTEPLEIAINTTQTAEAKLTQISLPSVTPTSPSTISINTFVATFTPAAIASPTIQTLFTETSTGASALTDVRTPTSPPSTCEHSILYTTSYSWIYDKPGGKFLDKHLRGGTILKCIKEVLTTNAKFYIVLNPLDGKEVAISDNEVTSEDPRSCFSLHAENFPEKIGYVYFSYCGYCMGGSEDSMEFIYLRDALSGTSQLPIPSIQTIYREGSNLKIKTLSKTYLIVTDSQKLTSDTYSISDGSLFYQTSDNTSYNLSTVSGATVTLQKVSCQEYK